MEIKIEAEQKEQLKRDRSSSNSGYKDRMGL